MGLKKKKKAINLNQSYKKEQKFTERERERERESTHNFVWEKYGLNGKTISNLYKIKQVEEESKYKKEEGSITIKRQKRKGKIGRSVIVDM